MRAADNTPFHRQCLVTAAVCGHVVGLGSSLGYPGVLLPQLQAPGSQLVVTDDMASWIASMTSISLVAGNLACPWIMERRGRRAGLYALALTALSGWLGLILATNFQMLLGARLLQGFSFGLSLPLRSVLIGEYTSPRNRGAFLTAVSLTQTFGLFFVHVVGSLLSWQKTALACMVFSYVSLLMTILYCPESQSYLAARGRYEECKEVFRWLRGDTEEQELMQMIEAREELQNTKVKLSFKEVIETIKRKEFYKPILLMIHMYAMIEFAGGAVMSSYFTVVLSQLLGPEQDVYLWMILLDVQRLLSNGAAVYFINRFKRRTLMFIIGPMSAFTMLAIAFYLIARDKGVLPYYTLWIPGLLINMKLFTLSTGMLPLPNVLAGEVFPLQYRGAGSSISILSTATFQFLIIKTFLNLLETIGLSGAYLIYSGVISYILVVLWVLLPETKGRTLQEIEDEYRGIVRQPFEEEISFVFKEK